MASSSSRRAAGETIAVGIGYFAAAQIGLLLQLPGTNMPAVWPPAGIGLAAVLLLGRRVWPAVTIAAFLANLQALSFAPAHVIAAALVAAGHTLESLTARALIARVCGSANPFDRTRHALWFVLAATVAGALSATVGVTSLQLTGVVTGHAYTSAWLTWVVSDVAGMIVLAPAIVAWVRNPSLQMSFPRACELAALAGLALLTGEMVFGTIGSVQVALSKPYQPLLLWTAFRFGQRETSTLGVIASMQAVSHTWAATMAPAAGGSATVMATLLLGTSSAPADWLRALQFFLFTTVTLALIVAAAVAERDQSRRALRDINQTLEERVRDRTSRLRASLEEKETLMREVHHRVKNNLSVVSSLLYLEADAAGNAHTARTLDDAQHRVRSIALVHDELYRSGNVTELDARQYFERLSSYLSQSYSLAPRQIVVDMHVDDSLVLDADSAISCGLVFTELLTNAFKHGFVDNRSGTIAVRLRRRANDICALEVADDGVGITGEQANTDSSTLGLRLVRLLTRQLRGTFAIGATARGTTAVVEFPIRSPAGV
jgi:two-component sensor histidine kinase/integral membrane sensor domain MASE1